MYSEVIFVSTLTNLKKWFYNKIGFKASSECEQKDTKVVTERSFLL